MKLNNEQLKHMAKLFDVMALASVAPILASITGIKAVPEFTLTQFLLFALSALILEIGAMIFLRNVK